MVEGFRQQALHELIAPSFALICCNLLTFAVQQYAETTE
jgi:hypothetical protein